MRFSSFIREKVVDPFASHEQQALAETCAISELKLAPHLIYLEQVISSCKKAWRRVLGFIFNHQLVVISMAIVY
jgi:hypothetical protein